MKSILFTTLAAFFAQQVAGHATFQQLWVNGVDQISLPAPCTCARLPLSNNPISSVTSTDIRCNAGTRPVANKCSVAAGQTVTVEIHEQPGDRNCARDGIGGNHYGPVMVYLSKVGDSASADGSSGWFKIYENTWKKNPSGWGGDDDFWGVKDINKCCGRAEVLIPADIAAGDYLLRAEVIALHTAGSAGGAQPYVTCFQLSVTGGGSATPATVNFPGAYSASDPGILVNIHTQMSSYTPPGPPVYSGGTTKAPGSGTCTLRKLRFARDSEFSY